MAPYLPRAGAAAAGGGAGGSPYSEGGALYALGLIYANHGHDIRPFLLESLRGTSNEVTQHGACLGLGEAAASALLCWPSWPLCESVPSEIFCY